MARRLGQGEGLGAGGAVLRIIGDPGATPVPGAGFCEATTSDSGGLPPPCHWMNRPWPVAWALACATVSPTYVPTTTDTGVGDGDGDGAGATLGAGDGDGDGDGDGTGVGEGDGDALGLGDGEGDGDALGLGSGPLETT